jgi:hypothetical protein
MRRVVSLHYVNVARGQAAGPFEPPPRYRRWPPEFNSRTIAAETTLTPLKRRRATDNRQREDPRSTGREPGQLHRPDD